jgi:hypothetical protein
MWHISPINVLPWMIGKVHLGKAHRLPDSAKSCLMVAVLGDDGSWGAFFSPAITIPNLPCFP